jgi:formyltetrahydrofolate deformylase
MESKKYILKITCIDKPGIIADLSSCLFHLEGNILTLNQYTDPHSRKFFSRIGFEVHKEKETIETKMVPIFEKHGISAEVFEKEHKPKILILCSKQDHCLTDLLAKHARGVLPAIIPAIVSNHDTLMHIAGWYNTPFFHFPVTSETKESQERAIRGLIEEYKIDYIVLARYMQILSPAFCEDFSGRIINIHHSFLPGFKGANPYRQAHERGVKIIGATVHFVTSDLDEGPIICQEVIRVNHTHTVADLTRYGSDIECVTLARGLKYVLEGKVFIDQNKTIVFK